MSGLPSEVSFCRSDDQVFAEVDGEIIMMDVVSGDYIGLNAVGSSIWGLIEVPKTLEQICAGLMGEYEIDEQTCRAETEHFLTSMSEKGMIKQNAQ